MTAFAAQVATTRAVGTQIDWQVAISGYDRIQLTVVGPDGAIFTREFKAGESPAFRLQDLANGGSGDYRYEMRVMPKVSAEVQRKLQNARNADDTAAVGRILSEAGLSPEALVQSGAFHVEAGSIMPIESPEGPGGGTRRITTNATNLKPVVNDQVIADDLIVQGSACVGLDCVNNESFGFDTIRLKENNTRIKFDDTSTTSGCPANDWQLTANDACGGASKFSIEDITGAKVPFTVTAGAPTNSIFVDSSGRIGLRTSTPGLDLHISTSNTPAIRLEQTNAGGFTAQTWDVAGNEANFFVRDVTGGSRLPFRIRPGAPTSSIDIAASGNVGIGTASPSKLLHLTSSTGNAAVQFTNNVPKSWHFANNGNDFNFSETGVADARLYIQAGGNVGINCNTPGSDLVVASGGGCSNPSSNLNAGDAQFTVASSRTFKQNISPVAVPDILDRIGKVGVYNYDFINGPKDRIGLIAEDFHTVLGRGNEKYINGGEVQVALWLAVQKLAAENKALTERLNAIDKELAPQQK